jgi:hypothetical protein
MKCRVLFTSTVVAKTAALKAAGSHGLLNNSQLLGTSNDLAT